MSAVTPQTEVYLLKCPLELDNQNQLDFATKSEQENYFKGLPKIYLDEFSYQRKDSVIRVNRHIDSLLQYTYVMYKNDNYSNKWFYAFITGMEYVNDNCTYVTIKTDVWQTWQFDLSWKRCFVAREHTNDDTVGKNLVPETLETGEYIQNKYDIIPYALDGQTGVPRYYICMQVTELPNITAPAQSQGKIYNGIPSGCWIMAFEYTQSGVNAMNQTLRWYDSNDKADAVVALFACPETVSYWISGTYNVLGNITIIFPVGSSGPELMKEYEFTPATTLDTYTPVNNKVYTYPYNYLYVSNNNGDTFEYRFEDFSDFGSPSTATNTKPRFKVFGSLCQGCQIKCVPFNYKKGQGIPESLLNWNYGGWDYAINGAKYPLLSWSSDYYLNWQAENGKYLATQTGINVISSIAGAAMNPLNAVTGGLAALNAFGQINSALHQQEVAQMKPDQAKGNVATGDLNFSASQDMITVRQMCIKKEMAKRIDDYFSAYGYQTNEYKIPNRTGRQNWNYVQTNGCNITADIPQQDLEEIKGLFNAGITIWHHANTFMDYSQGNSIVS